MRERLASNRLIRVMAFFVKMEECSSFFYISFFFIISIKCVEVCVCACVRVWFTARRCKASLFKERHKLESTAIRLSGFESWAPVQEQSPPDIMAPYSLSLFSRTKLVSRFPSYGIRSFITVFTQAQNKFLF
jgi:hypothetical protein